MKKFISILLVIAIVLGVLIFLISPNNVETFSTAKDFSIEEKINDLELDVFGKNKIELTEYELNQLAVPIIYDKLDKLYLKDKDIKINNLYIDCQKDKFCIQSDMRIWKINLGVRAYGLVTHQNGKLKFILSEFKVGKIKIGLNIIKKIAGIESEDFTIDIDNEELETININSLSIDEEGIELQFTTNNKKGIEQLIHPSEREFANEVLYILQKDEESKEFGNKLFKVLIKKRLEIKINEEDMFKVIDTFTKIDNSQKLRIIFALSKLHIDLEDIIEQLGEI